MISAAHDLSEGGLAQALVEMCLAGQTGARIVLPEGADPFVWLFSESTARVVVAVPRTEELRFTEMCTVRQQPWVKIGVVDAGDTGALDEQCAGHPGRRSAAAAGSTGSVGGDPAGAVRLTLHLMPQARRAVRPVRRQSHSGSRRVESDGQAGAGPAHGRRIAERADETAVGIVVVEREDTQRSAGSRISLPT